MLPRKGHHLSVYLPTHRKGPEIRQDPIRLKNLLRDARHRLADDYASQIIELTEPAEALVEDPVFWRHRDAALAVFLAHGFHRFYDLSVPCEELVIVSPHRFHVKPLLPLLTGNGRFFILALGLGETRLFDCDRKAVRQVEVDGMPRSLDETLLLDDPEQQIQFHTGTVGTPPSGRRDALYHGHGGGEDDARSNQLRFCRQVDAALRRRIADSNAPLVVAALPHLQGVYREANRYSHLISRGPSANPERMRAEDLQEQAWAIVRPHFEHSKRESAERFRSLSASSSRRAVSELRRVVPAACHSRIETLFVAVGVQRWGRFDPARGKLDFHDSQRPGDDDLIDLASTHTLANGGTVYAVSPGEVPSNAPTAAILRY
jgi:hypothetical protein